jgi:hypothetical protein
MEENRVTKKSYKKKPKQKPLIDPTPTLVMSEGAVAPNPGEGADPADEPNAVCENCAGNGEAPCPKCGSAGKVEEPENTITTEGIPDPVEPEPEPEEAKPEFVATNCWQEALLPVIHHLGQFTSEAPDLVSEAEGGLMTVREAFHALEGCTDKAVAKQAAKQLKADCLANRHGNVFTQQGRVKAADVVRRIVDQG